MTLIDDATRFTCSKLMMKHYYITLLKIYKAEVENQLDKDQASNV
jgi:hypothetical protein